MNLRNIQHLHDLILDDPRNKLSQKRLRVYNSLEEVEFESPVLVVITKVLQVVFPALLSRQARNTPSYRNIFSSLHESVLRTAASWTPSVLCLEIVKVSLKSEDLMKIGIVVEFKYNDWIDG